MKTGMKIGLMHNLYGSSSRGGAETVVKMMVQEYLDAGQDVFLITTKPRGAADPGPTPGGGLNNLKIYYLPSDFYKLAQFSFARRVLWQLGNLFSFRKYYQIRKILKIEKPDLVITHNLMGLGFLTPVAIRRLGLRHEHVLHDIQLLYPSGLLLWGQEKILDGGGAKIYQALTRRFFASPTAISSPSRWLLELHQARNFFPRSEKTVKPLRLPTEPRQKLSERPSDRPTDRPKNFLFVGQTEEHKGILFLIKTFKKITDPNIHLRIIGDGTKLTVAKNLSANDRRIEFMGRQANDRVRALMLNSDYLIVPSLCYENSPTVIYEAQAAGLRVIASDLGGIPEILGPRDRSFRPGDEEDLQQKIGERPKE